MKWLPRCDGGALRIPQWVALASLVLSGLTVGASILACGGQSVNDEVDSGRSDAGTCLAPRGICHGICTDLSKNQDHCGVCDRGCDPLERCESGRCVFYGCFPELSICNDTCRSLSAAETCGSCRAKCSAGQVCSLSQCRDACTAGLTACDGSCVDLTSDPKNCGGCGLECAEACVEGQCTACPPTWQACGGGCRAVDRDPRNCGLCGNACEPGTSCVQGSCHPEQQRGR